MGKIFKWGNREYFKSKRKFFYLAIIIIVGFFIYFNSLFNDFVWDDYGQIVENLVIRDWKNLPLALVSSTFYTGGAEKKLTGTFFRPIVSLSYFLLYNLFGLDSFFFHFAQLTIHLLNLILIFFILFHFFSSANFKNSSEAAFLATLFFAVHPANVEAVAYIGSMAEVLFTFFGLLSIIFLFFGLDWQKKIIKNKFLILSFFFSFFSLLSKETGIVVFLVSFLYIFLIFKPKLKEYLKWLFGAAGTFGIYIFLRLFVAKIPLLNNNYFSPIGEASLYERILTIPYEIFQYLKTIFFPLRLHISQHFVILSATDFRFWGVLLGLIILAFFLGFYIYKKKITNVQAFFLFWFFLCLMPLLNIVPLDMTVAERWLYFPMIGIFGFISSVLVENISKIKNKKDFVAASLILSVLIMAFGARTVIRNADWKDNLTLFGHDIKYSKQSFDLECNYGVALWQAGKYDEAEEHLKKAIELQKKSGCGYENLGVVYALKGDGEKAVEFFSKSIEIEDRYSAYANLGAMLVQLGKWEEAEDFLDKALLKFPHNPELKWLLSLVYQQKGEIEQANSLLDSALKDDPKGEKIGNLFQLLKEGKFKISK